MLGHLTLSSLSLKASRGCTLPRPAMGERDPSTSRVLKKASDPLLSKVPMEADATLCGRLKESVKKEKNGADLPRQPR